MSMQFIAQGRFRCNSVLRLNGRERTWPQKNAENAKMRIVGCEIMPFGHVIGHGFVLATSICHFFSILLYVIP
jgi:predicted membrane channel-forming protein YqfA (hemolysin III family)